MLDLNSIDPATIPASLELDALIAGEKWMGWHRDYSLSQTHSEYWRDEKNLCRPLLQWSPSTNPAHAGEARREADLNGVKHHGLCTVKAFVVANSDLDGHCDYSETNGDKGKAEALATCRAIVEALKANEAAGGE